MLLIYTKTLTPRINYTFKHVCTHILGIDIKFTSKIEEFVAHEGMKLSYGKQKLGNELFVQQTELLLEQGFSDTELKLFPWENTVGFFKVSDQSDLPFDIFSASFYLLSRYEEYLPHVKDEKGRYPSSESFLVKEEIIDQPLVDLWAFKFLEILKERFPNLEHKIKPFQNKNILAVAEVFKYKKKGIVRSVGASLRDFFRLNFSDFIERLKVLTFLKRDPYDVYDDIIAFSKQENLRWSFMFQLSNYSIYNKNISYHKVKYHALIKSMADYGPIGLLPGYEAISSLKVLKREKKRWEAIVNRPLKNTLVNDYDINLPNLYNNFDKLEIARDFSMSYADVIGFRAGTCTPFLFYDINFERISPLVIEPIAFNSQVLEKLSYFEVKKTLETIQEKVKKVGGDLVLIFKNSDFEDEQDKEKFLELVYKLHEHE
ncbi:polysaccharide deacetylase family protein [Mesonia aquimarina]|uniref:polysaccharide deacetylase family protein n=1 Tax=Mesonia aquimarina TaxID=1504967 RepID=UPI000EF611CA|nr:polysaccharide deacetylase family protein [Mesonia aquimarina]